MDHLLPDYLGIQEYAYKKNVYPSTVYTAIKNGRIKVVQVGIYKRKMINWTEFKDVKFRVNPGQNMNKNSVKNWFKAAQVKYKK